MQFSRAAQRVAAALGVTRLARLTGLDRIGVEVVGAVRPSGHVLQVTQGKGDTLDAAAWSALGEAAELHAAETAWRNRVVLCDDGPSVEATWLTTKHTVMVPAELIFCPPWGQGWFGLRSHQWTSNGLAAGRTREDAIEHAMLELFERDSLARVLPEGWLPALARRRLVRSDDSLIAQCAQAGCEAYVFDLTSAQTPFPVAGALLFDTNGVVPLTAGYACRRDASVAVHAALLEAAQSRLTEIHGAREDVTVGTRDAGHTLLEALRSTHAKRAFTTRRKQNRAASSIAVVELTTKPLVIVKAVSETLLHSSLLE